ncbi:PHAGE TAIL PROTEIN [Mycetohabitans rhizoxinica HKI 454]|uniref:PHAGE TAIL PROTEIN n=1 Tax=Mycetohabitans rhizoxinica (strain DSM 19002 / CIP 109453 / HKI 454) TaxID=882378 RepID=E5AKP3_MYCRK|nr:MULTISPECIES: hypothetical protein [Mycetohabitans]MCG1046042.1 hypothetical protein [Mycetohabitans sp. B6]CBW73715.1 PHAGE TAIL PROTEIN [Mycetohabitans rhizoxinica HKI 454]
MAGTPITVSEAFRAALVSGNHQGTVAHTVTHIGLCTAAFDASGAALKQLPHELKRIDTFGGQHVDAATIHITIQDNSPDQYALYGFGLYLEDGTLAAYYSQPAGDGPIMEKSPAATLLLSTDIQFTTIDAGTLGFESASFVNPPASTEHQGVIEIATQAEVDAGEDDTRAVTPRTANARYAPREWVLRHALPLRDALEQNVDLNTVTSTGIYLQPYTRGASVELNYPVAFAGKLQVYALYWTVYQTYTVFNSGISYTRVRYDRTWSPWRRVLDDGSDVVVSGIGAFCGALGATSLRAAATGVVLGANVGGDLVFKYTEAPTHHKLWDIKTSANAFECRAVNDGWTDVNRWLIVTRAGLDISTVGLATDGGRVLIGEGATDDGASALQVAGTATAATPPTGDVSHKLATTQFVANAISEATIGQIIIEARTSVRAGCLKLAGVLIQRDDYPQLWTYAQSCGALVSEDEWPDNPGCFSTGDGKTTFRIPEVRGEHLRFWDDGRGVDSGRGIGTWQDSQNRAHAHAATASVEGDHVHGAWMDERGWHIHAVHDPGHNHATEVPYGGGHSPVRSVVGPYGIEGYYNTHHTLTGISIHGDGNHIHNVGIGNAGNHSHTITVNDDGGTEARPRNIALLAMIRAY